MPSRLERTMRATAPATAAAGGGGGMTRSQRTEEQTTEPPSPPPRRSSDLRRGGDAEALDAVALGADDASHRAGYGRGGGGSGNDAIPAGVAQTFDGVIELGPDVFVQLVELERCGRVVLEEVFPQAHGAERLGISLTQAAVFGAD